jgi:hypothetical protein
MGYVRLVHPKHWESNRGRFSDLAYKKSTDGGLSVFDVECAEQDSGLICEHIRRYYENVGGDPAIFVVLEPADLPPAAKVARTPSKSPVEIAAGATNDECHHEVDGVGDKALKKALMKVSLDRFRICDTQGVRALALSDLVGEYIPTGN